MGSSYSNLTLKGPSHEAVAAFLARSGRTAYVSIQDEGCVVVCDEAAEMQDPEAITESAVALSTEFKCPALAVLVHDSDILVYWLLNRGALIDEYNSCPGYFDDGPTEPSGGDEAKLAAAMGDGSIPIGLDRILRPSADSDGYDFEEERHSELVSALGISELAVGTGFGYIAADDVEAPPGAFLLVGEA